MAGSGVDVSKVDEAHRLYTAALKSAARAEKAIADHADHVRTLTLDDLRQYARARGLPWRKISKTDLQDHLTAPPPS